MKAIKESRRLGKKADSSKLVSKQIRTLVGTVSLVGLQKVRAENVAKSPLTIRAKENRAKGIITTRPAPITQPSIISKAKIISTKLKTAPSSITGTVSKSLSSAAIAQRNITRLKTQTKQRIKLAQTPIVRQIIQQQTRQRLRVLQRTLQQLRQQQRVRQLARAKVIAKPKLKFPLVPPILIGGKKKIVKKKPVGEPTGKFDVFTRKGGKFRRINKKPLTKSQAQDLGAFRTSQTLRRSFKIVKSTRAGTGTIKDKLKGFFAKNKDIFRPAKRNGNILVEKTKFALSTGREKTDIQKARRLAKRRKK